MHTQAGEAHAALQARLAAAVAGALKKARGRVFAFRQQLASAAAADEVRKRGDLITANLYRIPPGAESVEVRWICSYRSVRDVFGVGTELCFCLGCPALVTATG